MAGYRFPETNRYPTPLILTICFGSDGSYSILFRISNPFIPGSMISKTSRSIDFSIADFKPSIPFKPALCIGTS